MKKTINLYFFIIFILIIFIGSISINSNEYLNNNIQFMATEKIYHYNKNSSYTWPIIGYYNISSSFGYRISPTTHASTYHSGIDIPAPEGTDIYAISNGIILYTGFFGADGYSIIIKEPTNNLEFIYGHVSPNFIVTKNQTILQNQKIGFVGPKYIESIENTKYFDNTGRKTNGATTRPTFTFNYKKRRPSRQSFRLFINITYHHHTRPSLIQLNYYI